MAETVGVLDRGHVAVIGEGMSGIGLVVAETPLDPGVGRWCADIDEPDAPMIGAI